MKRLLSVILVLASALLFAGDLQYSKTITVTAGTRIRVFNVRTPAASVLIQMLHGGTGLGYIYSADPGSACSTGQLIGELAPASSTAPGGSYSDKGDSTTQGGAVDLNFICLDGSNSGDTILVSYRPR